MGSTRWTSSSRALTPLLSRVSVARWVSWASQREGMTVFKERVRELRPAYLPPDPTSRTVYVAGELAQFEFTLGRPTPGGQFQPPSTLTGVAGVPQAVLLGERP